tara:strand:+ start:101 stop:355 length:255 start_codon:yes stop_codon:yes gene_type:complete
VVRFLHYLCNPLITDFSVIKNTLISPSDKSRKDCMDVRLTIPIHLMDKVEEVRKEWGLQSRGSVIVRLLEVLFEEKDQEGGLGH